MILFKNTHPMAIKVLLIAGNKTDNLGTLRKPDKDSDWIWDFVRISWMVYGTIDHTDKRAIIGMIDKLNGLLYRPQETLLDRWREISGLTPEYQSQLETYMAL